MALHIINRPGSRWGIMVNILPSAVRHGNTEQMVIGYVQQAWTNSDNLRAHIQNGAQLNNGVTWYQGQGTVYYNHNLRLLYGWAITQGNPCLQLFHVDMPVNHYYQEQRKALREHALKVLNRPVLKDPFAKI